MTLRSKQMDKENQELRPHPSERKRKLKIFSDELANYLATIEGRPWSEYCRGKPITQRQIAALLKPFGIKPKRMRIGTENKRGYEREQFKDAFIRYLGIDPEHWHKSSVVRVQRKRDLKQKRGL